MQKESLRKIPFVGFASEKAGHVFVDNTNPKARAASLEKAKEQIVDGVSMVIFPEGARTRSGNMGRFKRGAYYVAHDMKLPVVPLTINGAYDVLHRDGFRLKPGKMELVIHQPVPTEFLTEEELSGLVEETRDTIYSALWEKYK